VEQVRDPGDVLSRTHRLPDEPIEALRIEQPTEGGHSTRPNLLWIAQLRLLPRP